MPQMSPLNWLILFMFFSMIFILINIINYFNISLTTSWKTNKNYKMFHWKW